MYHQIKQTYVDRQGRLDSAYGVALSIWGGTNEITISCNGYRYFTVKSNRNYAHTLVDAIGTEWDTADVGYLCCVEANGPDGQILLYTLNGGLAGWLYSTEGSRILSPVEVSTALNSQRRFLESVFGIEHGATRYIQTAELCYQKRWNSVPDNLGHIVGAQGLRGLDWVSHSNWAGATHHNAYVRVYNKGSEIRANGYKRGESYDSSLHNGLVRTEVELHKRNARKRLATLFTGDTPNIDAWYKAFHKYAPDRLVLPQNDNTYLPDTELYRILTTETRKDAVKLYTAAVLGDPSRLSQLERVLNQLPASSKRNIRKDVNMFRNASATTLWPEDTLELAPRSLTQYRHELDSTLDPYAIYHETYTPEYQQTQDTDTSEVDDEVADFNTDNYETDLYETIVDNAIIDTERTF